MKCFKITKYEKNWLLSQINNFIEKIGYIFYGKRGNRLSQQLAYSRYTVYLFGDYWRMNLD